MVQNSSMLAECQSILTKIMEASDLFSSISDSHAILFNILNSKVLLKNWVKFYFQNICLICAHINTLCSPCCCTLLVIAKRKYVSYFIYF